MSHFQAEKVFSGKRKYPEVSIELRLTPPSTSSSTLDFKVVNQLQLHLESSERFLFLEFLHSHHTAARFGISKVRQTAGRGYRTQHSPQLQLEVSLLAFNSPP